MSIETVASRAARPTRAPRQRGGAGREGGRASPRANRAGWGWSGHWPAIWPRRILAQAGGVLIQWYYAPSEWKVALARHVPEPLRGEAEHYLRGMLYRMEVAEWFRKAPARTAAT
jgi:hypothetical protein